MREFIRCARAINSLLHKSVGNTPANDTHTSTKHALADEENSVNSVAAVVRNLLLWMLMLKDLDAAPKSFVFC